MKSRIGIALLSLVAFGSLIGPPVSADNASTIIKVSAKRFEYVPQEIRLKKDVPVVFQITTEDRSHGFNIPSANLRADVLPGKVTELKWTPHNTGAFDFSAMFSAAAVMKA